MGKHSTHPTAVEYASQEMMKGRSIETSAKRTAQKLNGYQNLFFGGEVVEIDPDVLAASLWERLLTIVLNNLTTYKHPYDALDVTLQHYGQWPVGKPMCKNCLAMRRQLKTMVISNLGYNPFTGDPKE